MNKYAKRCLGLLIPLILLYVYVPAQEISKFEICGDVVEREPKDIRNVYRVDESAWAWMRLTNGTVGDSIAVEWYIGEEMVHSHKLAVKYESMRTYATKKLTKPGSWKVVIRNKEGESLEEGTFQVGEG